MTVLSDICLPINLHMRPRRLSFYKSHLTDVATPVAASYSCLHNKSSFCIEKVSVGSLPLYLFSLTFLDFTARGWLRQEVYECPSTSSNCAYHIDLCPANFCPSIITGLDLRINDSEVVGINEPVQTCFVDFIVTRFAILRIMDPQDWWANYPLTCFWDFSGVSWFLIDVFSSSLISTWIKIWRKGFMPFMLQDNYYVSLVIGQLGNVPSWI